ncbi:uncharacterized protein L969DRAFT_52382 [Mixia osmundae IAM 14324]|uniref:K Homology domain-containing protein n=1 Tax=Mixia osmundae (strain CBS 9802 / IAM 14324 / JCM 22182 / KY 12970) TaxID=764103 RepID=G7E4Z7_MIXOS|nr:uncharacterized protein L969DRAFT_52382 [Mixia osmundae IAM 14324]KEI37768.1 hypothetical protein L969DRAFT_52382 [Mixia osmundae IAM 14324]GAA97907.1 hypothetical protein E5Q_04587 [Mixia osmundae IAM 14324]
MRHLPSLDHSSCSIAKLNISSRLQGLWQETLPSRRVAPTQPREGQQIDLRCLRASRSLDDCTSPLSFSDSYHTRYRLRPLDIMPEAAPAAAVPDVDGVAQAVANLSTTEKDSPAVQPKEDAPPQAPIRSQAASPPGQAEAPTLIMRALVSSREAGIVIGRQGKNVADIREKAQVKAGVSKLVPGVSERVLTVTGQISGVARAFGLICQTIMDNSSGIPNDSPSTYTGLSGSTLTLRLLISSAQMGGVIGKAGTKIKSIQQTSGTRMAASKELLPQSTERLVEISGRPEQVEKAVAEIAKALVEDEAKAVGTIAFHPANLNPELSGLQSIPPIMRSSSSGTASRAPAASDGRAPGMMSMQQPHQQPQHMYPAAYAQHAQPAPAPAAAPLYGYTNDHAPPPRRYVPPQGYRANDPRNTPQDRYRANASIASAAHAPDPNLRTQNISIPSDMVGCIIGKGGQKINDIRKSSGSKISIAKTAHDETGERMFTITGTAQNNETALFLLYGQLENEKERRLRMDEEGGVGRQRRDDA